MLNEFKAFIARGNVMDLAVGVIIGAAFNKIVESVVNDLVMPVVGALTGVIGSMAALEVIKLITGAGEALTGRLMLYDGLAGTARTVRVAADPECPVCGG